MYVDSQTSLLIISGSPPFELKRLEKIGHSGHYFYFKNDTGSLHHVDMKAEEAARELADEVLMHKTAKSENCGCKDEDGEKKDCVCEDKEYECEDCEDEDGGDKDFEFKSILKMHSC